MSIRISDKHGVNPSLMQCFYCNEATTGIALLGKLPGDAEAPRQGVFNLTPCDDCKAKMAQGVLIMSCKDSDFKDANIVEQGNLPNPYRTGGWVIVKDEAIQRIMPGLIDGDDQAKERYTNLILRRRWVFLGDSLWDAIGLPRN